MLFLDLTQAVVVIHGMTMLDGIMLLRLAMGSQASLLAWHGLPVLLGDLFTVVLIWIWVTMFRGPAVRNIQGTAAEILAAWAIIVPIDLFLSFQYGGWMLVPSAILNVLVLGIGMVACIVRFPRRGIPLLVAIAAYSLAKLPAYAVVVWGELDNGGVKLRTTAPESWIYYALGFSELVIFLLLCDLLVRASGIPRALSIRRLFRLERSVAVVALLVAAVEHWGEFGLLIPFTTVAVPALAVILAFRGVFLKRSTRPRSRSKLARGATA